MPSKATPPGLPLVLPYVPLLVLPLLIVYLSSFFVSLSSWTFVLLSILSFPTCIAGQITVKGFNDQRVASSLGASLPPTWNGAWFGNVDILLHLLEASKRGYLGDEVIEGHIKLGGTYNMRLLWEDCFITNDVNIVKTILATEFHKFEKGPVFRSSMNSVLGTGVFNADGDMWKFHRSMTRPFFSRDRVVNFDIFDLHSDKAIRRMRDRMQEGLALDFQDLCSRFALDSATEFLFGRCVDSLDSRLPSSPIMSLTSTSPETSPASRFGQAFARAQETIAYRFRLGWVWAFQEIFVNKTAEDMRVIDAFLDPILQEAIANHTTSKEYLVRSTTDPQILHDEVLNILVAGRDTIASTLTFAMYFLCTHPDVLQRLRSEIMEIVGSMGRPSVDDIHKMKYLRAFVNEVLRLFPVVPFNTRCATVDTTIPNPDPHGKPFYVPKGTQLVYSTVLMHRRPDYWGDDADVFDPDRFLDDRVKRLVSNPFIFLPFNAGPRICLGQQFAYNEISFFLIRLLQNFDSMDLDLDSWDPETLPPKEWADCSGRKGIEKIFPKSNLTAYVNGGLWLRVTDNGKL